MASDDRGAPTAAGPGTGPPQPRLARGRLALRPTREADLDFVVTAESRPEAARFVEQWPRERHCGCLGHPGFAHWIVEADGDPIGYAILQDTDDPDHSVLLRRIVVARHGRGFGRGALLLVARYCFDVLRCHRLWLYVAVGNRRAYGLYRRLGFVEEGVARECVRQGAGYASMHILSLLAHEYREWLVAQRRRRPHQP